ncbi:DMT family transporter [Halovulum sp. GXIMD14794]
MHFMLYAFAAVLLGALVAMQPLINAVLAAAVGSPAVATTISIFVAFLGALMLLAVMGTGAGLSRAALASVPWWAYLAGFIGTLFVGGAIVIAPVTGALVFFVCIVAGQLVGATLADHFGAFGLENRPVSALRIAGLALVLIGAVMVQKG